jgi:hypothetical protein
MILLIGDLNAKLYNITKYNYIREKILNSRILHETSNSSLACNEARLENFLTSINVIIRHKFPTLCYT